MEKITAHGPVVIVRGKLLVSKDKKDGFYKVPGGRPRPGESGDETCVRRTKEETGIDVEVVEELSMLRLDKNPTTEEEGEIELHHYRAIPVIPVKSFKSYLYNGFEVAWLPIREIKDKKHDVAPNIKFLILKGELR
jgi:8-oxo-dGTP pyrophosphatase MutT (NUDIX family)